VKRGGSLSFLVGTISNVLVMEIGHDETSIPPYNFVAGGIKILGTEREGSPAIHLFNRIHIF
jgi:hypothetical protein